MFVGTIPRPAVEQALDCTDFGQSRAIFVCCSGSFRWERVLRARYPDLRLVGCDVSIYSVAIGRFLAGDPLRFRFRERLASFEERLVGKMPIDRLAFLIVALQMATYRGANAHARAMFQSYVDNIDGHAAALRPKLTKLAEEVGTYEFFAGDFRAHARQASAEGAAIVGAADHQGRL
jgi:DNA adenine methylase-like protein